MNCSTAGVLANCPIVSGKSSSDEAKIAGITPAVFTRSGK
jgi:hypothetical protein